MNWASQRAVGCRNSPNTPLIEKAGDGQSLVRINHDCSRIQRDAVRQGPQALVAVVQSMCAAQADGRAQNAMHCTQRATHTDTSDCNCAVNTLLKVAQMPSAAAIASIDHTSNLCRELQHSPQACKQVGLHCIVSSAMETPHRQTVTAGCLQAEPACSSKWTLLC